MEYGHEITDTVGNKTFFIEGCTYCSMSTGGLHSANCLLSPQTVYLFPELREERLMDENLRSFYHAEGTVWLNESAECSKAAYEKSQQDMLLAGYVAVEPLIEEK